MQFPYFSHVHFRILAIIITNMGQQSVKLSLHIRVVLDPHAMRGRGYGL